MVFDRNAMSTGRGMQDFGLCDLKGVYQHSSRLRTKGFLAIAFVDPDTNGTPEVITALMDWTGVSPKVAAVIVACGERDAAEEMGNVPDLKIPILWDAESYVASTWSVTAVPTIFIVNDKGLVLGRVRGTNSAEFASVHEMLVDEVRKSDEAAAAAAVAKAAADAAKATEPAKK